MNNVSDMRKRRIDLVYGRRKDQHRMNFFRIKRGAGFTAALLILSTVLAGVFPGGIEEAFGAELGSGSQSYRINVLTAVGIADGSADDTESICTRAEFARMLVMASTYQDSVGSASTAAASDVPATYPGAQYIKTALTEGWMRTRLGGGFQPDAGVTLQEAARAAMAMLGYTDEDFPNNLAAGRLAKFQGLNLNDGILKTGASEILTRADAMNVIYNLLRTKPKNSNSIYGSAINLTLAADNELNATALVEASLTGPILVRNEGAIQEVLPFALEESTLYYNGTQTGTYLNGLRYYSSQLNNTGWLILYYNANSKTVWGYGSDTGNNTYHCVRGRVSSITYEDDNIASPSSVWIDNTEYTLNSADVKFMFSVNGEIRVGDDVVLICKANSSNNDDEDMTDYYAVAVVQYSVNTSAGAVDSYGTLYAAGAGHYKVVNAAGEDITASRGE